MRNEKKTIQEILNLPEGKTIEDVILALMDSELMDEPPIEKMITAATSYFMIVNNLRDIDPQVVSALYMMERIFALYSELASKYDNGKAKRKEVLVSN
jgi:hypothetical protein